MDNDADVIYVQGATNDFNQNGPLGDDQLIQIQYLKNL